MASDDARARQGEGAAAQDAADPAEPVRTRFVSGWAPKPTVDTSLLLDEDREPEHVFDASEPTLVTPGELIESLRAASRAELESAPSTATESRLPPFDGSAVNEEITTIFVLHEDGELHPAWVRKAISVFAGAAMLTALLTLVAIPSRAPAMPRKAVHGAAPSAPQVEKAPVPTVVQLQPSMIADLNALEKPATQEVANLAPQELDAKHKWMRALERGNARLLAREFDAAVFSFERAIEYHPQDPKAYVGLAEAQRERGKWNEAARAYREAIALSPDDASLREALDQINAQSGSEEEATQAEEQAAEPEFGGTE